MEKNIDKMYEEYLKDTINKLIDAKDVKNIEDRHINCNSYDNGKTCHLYFKNKDINENNWHHVYTKNYFLKKTYVSGLNGEEFETKYKPYIVFPKKYIYCVQYIGTIPGYCFGEEYAMLFGDYANPEASYLYDRENNIYHKLPPHTFIDCGIIFCGKDRNPKLFIYNGKIIDVTKVLDQNFSLRTSLMYLSALPQANINILTREEFETEYLKSSKRVMDNKIDAELNQSKLEEDKVKALNDLASILTKLNELKNTNIDFKKTKFDNILVDVGDHKEIDKDIRNVLKYIDLSGVNFEGVDISGIDFSDTNANINPQKVYNKDLSCCDFSGIFVDPITKNFNGVNIKSAKFSHDNDPFTYDIMPDFSKAIYDENTTYNGVSLYNILGECKLIEKNKSK